MFCPFWKEIYKWIQHVVKMSEKLDATSDIEYREILCHMRTRTTLQWWECIEVTLGQQGLQGLDVTVFRILFEKQFVPSAKQEQLKREFMSLEQGPISVQMSITQFNEVGMFAASIMDDENEKIVCFIHGLIPKFELYFPGYYTQLTYMMLLVRLRLMLRRQQT